MRWSSLCLLICAPLISASVTESKPTPASKRNRAILQLPRTVKGAELAPGAAPLVDHNPPEVKQILDKRCKDFKLPWQVPISKELPEADIPKKCTAGDRIFGDRLVLIARHTEDIGWLATHLDPPFLVYQSGGDTAAHRSEALGNEVSPYLTFIAEYYDCLPDTTLFAHAHRFSLSHSWQTLDHDANNANWDKVPGFAMKHRVGLWLEVNHIHQPELWWQHPVNITVQEAQTFSCAAVYKGTPYEGKTDSRFFTHAAMVSRIWDELLEPQGMGPKPDRLRTSYSAEMFVTAKAIRAHPRSFYTKALKWMANSQAKGALNQWSLGGVFELTWHVIFGQPAFMEKPSIAECELYNCNQTADIADRSIIMNEFATVKARIEKEMASKKAALGVA